MGLDRINVSSMRRCSDPAQDIRIQASARDKEIPSMSADSANRQTSPRQGTLNDVANVAEATRRRLGLQLGDLFHETHGLQLIHTVLVQYGIEFLARLASTRRYAEIEPFMGKFNGTPATWWEVNRRAAAVALLLHMRELASEQPRICTGQGWSAYVFLGFMPRDMAYLPLTVAQMADPSELNSIVELWARRDGTSVLVWYLDDRGRQVLELAPSDVNNPYVTTAETRFVNWLAHSSAR
jgi:hypothetical protein